MDACLRESIQYEMEEKLILSLGRKLTGPSTTLAHAQKVASAANADVRHSLPPAAPLILSYRFFIWPLHFQMLEPSAAHAL